MVLLPLHLNLNLDQELSVVNTSTKLSRSPVTQLMEDVDATTVSSSSPIKCQRYSDESGIVQIEFNQDPTALAGAELVIEGRLEDGGPWGLVADGSTHPELDFTNYSATVLSLITTEPVRIPPQVRATLNDVVGNVAASTTINVWIQE